MSTNIYVGNLPFSATAEDIRDLFSAYGTVGRGAGNATRRHLEQAHDI
jgi:hypothetical protein